MEFEAAYMSFLHTSLIINTSRILGTVSECEREYLELLNEHADVA